MLDMIGDQLKEIRLEYELDGPQFAKIARTTKQFVGQLENGRNKKPNPEMLLAWAKHFGIRLEWIIAREQPKFSVSQTARLDATIVEDAIRQAAESDADAEAIRDFVKAYEHLVKVRTKGRAKVLDLPRKSIGAESDGAHGTGNSGAIGDTQREKRSKKK